MQSLDGVQVLYFFFKNGDPKTSTAAEMMASIVDQLVMSTRNIPELAKQLIGTLERGKQTDNSEKCRSVSKLWGMFTTMLQAVPFKVMVILDALDECDDCSTVTKHLTQAVGARFLATSRPEQHISEELENSPVVSAVEMDVANDITNFITKKIEDHPTLQRFKDDIIVSVEQNSGGMFRYAALMLEELQVPSKQKITNIIKKMPKGLYGMYEAILLRLDWSEQTAELRREILMWITMAKRPVTVAEMAYAYGTVAGEDFDPEEITLADRTQMLNACGSLVEIFDGDKLRFTHLSVKEFLLQSSDKLGTRDERIISCLVDPRKAHISIAEACGKETLSTTLLRKTC
jgi:hypothetical protein